MEQIKELVEQFRYNIKDYTSWNFNETNTRQQFIDKFFELLGWDVNNHFWRSEQYKEVVLEDKLKINWQAKAPDYSFRLWGRRIFFVEAKKPSVNIKDDVEPAYQIRRYSWTAKLPIGILTDFEELAIYDTRVKPNPTDKAGTARIKYFSFEEFEENREWIYNTLSKEAVEKWALDKYIQESKKTWTLSVDVDFLNMIDDRRDALAKNIYLRYGHERNRDLDRLNNIVGDIVDKIIFLRIAEDKKIENSWNLETIANGKEIWKHLIRYFEASDKKYNSWLFDNTEIFKKFELDDKILKQILVSLYYPACPYEFSVLWVDILGNIYEKFLGKTLVKEGRTIKTEFKPDVKKAGWVFYTPQYIVDYIVKNTVWELLKWKTPKQALELNIVDPACGSGAFLIGAYDYILNRFLEQHTLNDETIKKSIKEGKIYQFKSGYHLSFAYKKEILKNMIYGVDIDRQAVAVSRLSLLLKLLEWETAETANQLFSTIDAALLPKLDNNIKCGNSLVDSSIYTNLESPDEATIKKINAFDWEKEFAEVFAKWGFDTVIGNPPYNKERDNARLFEPIKKSNYKKYYQGKMDFWYLFLHRAIDIVKEKWNIGFITNSYWIKGLWAKTLIERIKKELTFTHIIDFDSLPVFQWVSWKHMIHMYKKEKASKSKKTKYLKVENLNFSIEGIDDKKAEKLESNQLVKENLTISFDSSINIFEWKNYQKLGDLFEVSQWVVEATDKISKNQLKENINFKVWDWVFVLNKNEVKELNLNEDEKKLLKKYLNTSHVNRYWINFKDEYLIYSDKVIKEEIKSGKYPNIKKHLDKMKQFITSSNQPYWLHRFRKKEFFENPKLICKWMFKTPEFYYDEEWYFVGFSFSVIINKELWYSLKFLLWLMNSKLWEIWFERYGKKRWVWVDIGVWVFREFPIPKVSESLQQPIIELVDQMIVAQKKFKETEFEDDKKVIQKQMEIIDGKIDELVFDLYGLNEEEKKVVLDK